ncbi:MAG: hypothetical protein ABIS86_17055 [Streptosporangiaceae bacterium]
MTSLILPADTTLSPRQARTLGERFARELAATGKRGQMVVTETNFARIYIYAGEFVADCPRRDCGNTVLMTLKDDRERGVPWTPYERLNRFDCRYCGYGTDSVRWPVNAGLLLDVLDCRPIPHTRNWYPEGHVTAVKAGVPDGQSVADLVRENGEHGVATRFEVLQMIEGGEGWPGLHR